MMMVFLVLLGIEGLSYMLNDENKKRLSQNETAFFVFAKKIGQVLTSLSQNLPVSLIFCILGNQVKISQR